MTTTLSTASLGPGRNQMGAPVVLVRLSLGQRAVSVA